MTMQEFSGVIGIFIALLGLILKNKEDEETKRGKIYKTINEKSGALNDALTAKIDGVAKGCVGREMCELKHEQSKTDINRVEEQANERLTRLEVRVNELSKR